MTEDEQQLASAIKRLRAHFGESQQQFSDRLGVTVRSVARYEAEKAPSLEVIRKLASIASEAGEPGLALTFGSYQLQVAHKNSLEAAYELRTMIQEMARSAGHSLSGILWLAENGDPTFRDRIDEVLRQEIREAVRKRGTPLSEKDRSDLGSLAEGIE